MRCDLDDYSLLLLICSYSKFCGRIYSYGLFIDPERKKTPKQTSKMYM